MKSSYPLAAQLYEKIRNLIPEPATYELRESELRRGDDDYQANRRVSLSLTYCKGRSAVSDPPLDVLATIHAEFPDAEISYRLAHDLEKQFEITIETLR